MEYFVNKHSVVREIWGKSDTVLFIFAGASAEFALNKAVDWLYFTGRLPADPLGRLFSTVSYARTIVFAERETAMQAIASIVAIHRKVESNRGATIPDWAYRDVLFMLIDYSISAFELLERRLGMNEKEEVFDVFLRVGKGMGLKGLPGTFNEWLIMRKEHLANDLQMSDSTTDLYQQYRNHLGLLRFHLLLEAQKLVVPGQVSLLLKFRKRSLLSPLIGLYKMSKKVHVDRLFKSLIMPLKYKNEIRELDVPVS